MTSPKVHNLPTTYSKDIEVDETADKKYSKK